jgi:ribosomal protein L11 methyltransferase
MKTVAWTRLEVTIAAEAVEAVSNFLIELGSPGLQIDKRLRGTRLRAYLPGRVEGLQVTVDEYLQRLRKSGLPVESGTIAIDYLAPTDWLALWRARQRPLRVGRRLLVRPSWLTHPQENDLLTMVIDSQMAFGTGHHATTQFCLCALEDLVRRGDRVLDVGTGSGILSIAAAKLGAGHVLGLDTDPQAIATARENVRINEVGGLVRISNREVRSLTEQSRHLVVANIDGHTLTPLLPWLLRIVGKGGHLILAGYFLAEEASLCRQLNSLGLHPDRLERCHEWVSAVVQRPDSNG